MPDEVKSTATQDLPKTKRRPSGLKHAESFAELIRLVGKEAGLRDGQEIPKREILIRMLFDGLTTGKIVFPDGREMVLDYPRWQELTWNTIRHLDLVSINAKVGQSGALVGSALMSNITLYLPANGRELDGRIGRVFEDPAAEEIVDVYPSVAEEVHQGEVQRRKLVRLGGNGNGNGNGHGG